MVCACFEREGYTFRRMVLSVVVMDGLVRRHMMGVRGGSQKAETKAIGRTLQYDAGWVGGWGRRKIV